MSDDSEHIVGTWPQRTVRILLGLCLPSVVATMPFIVAGASFSVIPFAFMLIGIQSLMASLLAELWLQRYHSGIFLSGSTVFGVLSGLPITRGIDAAIIFGCVVGFVVGTVLRGHYGYFRRESARSAPLRERFGS